MDIIKANQETIESVAELEKIIEGGNAALQETLIGRMNMFPEGFRVATENGKVIGYVESCLWDKDNFETFDEIRDFPNNHNPEGKTLYVIYLAVDENQRKRGVGGELIKKLQTYALEHNLDKVQLVAKESLIHFYQGLGFESIKELPKFLPNSNHMLMDFKIK